MPSWINIVDDKDPDAVVDERAYQKICKLMQLMVHPDLHCSIYEGLEDYAWLFITATLCTKCRDADERYYITALLEIARKNFKTFNSAVIFIVLMLTEPAFSRFFSGCSGSVSVLRAEACDPQDHKVLTGAD